MDVRFIGFILCADKCQSQVDFSLKKPYSVRFAAHRTLTHTHTHTPCTKEKNLAEVGNVLGKGLGFLHVCSTFWLTSLD